MSVETLSGEEGRWRRFGEYQLRHSVERRVAGDDLVNIIVRASVERRLDGDDLLDVMFRDSVERRVDGDDLAYVS